MAEPNEPTQDYDVESDMQYDARGEEKATIGALSAGIGRALVDHRPPSVTEKLLNEKHELELRLRAIDEVLGQLAAQPDTMAIIDNLSKLGHNY